MSDQHFQKSSDAIPTPRGDGNVSGFSFPKYSMKMRSLAPSWRYDFRPWRAANRAISSKAARFIRRRRRIAAFPARGQAITPGGVSKGEGPQSLPFVPRGGMGDGGLHRHGVTIPGPGGPSIVPFPRKRAAFSAAGGAWPAFPHVSGGGLRGRYLCAKDTFPLPWHGNAPLREQREYPSWLPCPLARDTSAGKPGPLREQQPPTPHAGKHISIC